MQTLVMVLAIIKRLTSGGALTAATNRVIPGVDLLTRHILCMRRVGMVFPVDEAHSFSACGQRVVITGCRQAFDAESRRRTGHAEARHRAYQYRKATWWFDKQHHRIVQLIQ